MHNKYGGTTLDEALRGYSEFHILEGQSVEWSKEHSFKCNCPHFCLWTSCHHGFPCTMVCKPSLVLPPQYLGSVLHSRGKRDRPCRGDQGEDEGEESVGSRDQGCGPVLGCPSHLFLKKDFNRLKQIPGQAASHGVS